MYRTIFGIDSHARTTTICALDTETGEREKKTFRGNPYSEMRDWMSRFPGPAVGVYEAGCTGFVPARELTTDTVEVHPIAPSKMPRDDDSTKKKNDRMDAERLARWEFSQSLKHVWVPDEETEGLRDISHAIEDACSNRTTAYLRVQSLLCRHGIVWDRRTKAGNLKATWTREYWGWLDSIVMPTAASQAALDAAIRCARSAKEQYDALVAEARRIASESSYARVIEALCCLKCVQFVTALAFVAEVGDFLRFSSGRKLNSYLGLCPREGSSADKRLLGSMTKSGTHMLRKLLVECAWAAMRCNKAPKKRLPGVDQQIYEYCVTLSKRLADHRDALVARGVSANKANGATAAELARFMLFVAREVQEADARKAAEAASAETDTTDTTDTTEAAA